MNVIELIQFVEEANALVQQLKSDGTLDKLLTAEQALMLELNTNASIKKLETLIEGFLAKKATTTTTTTVKSGS